MSTRRSDPELCRECGEALPFRVGRGNRPKKCEGCSADDHRRRARDRQRRLQAERNEGQG